ncbi:MAG: hypothetical protein VW258_15825, partial [Thalassolituus sp.]
HEVQWQVGPLNGIIDISSDARTLEFDPSGLDTGEYVITATVTDNGIPALSATSELTMTVERSLEQSPKAPSSKSGGGSAGDLILLGALLAGYSRRRSLSTARRL